MDSPKCLLGLIQVIFADLAKDVHAGKYKSGLSGMVLSRGFELVALRPIAWRELRVATKAVVKRSFGHIVVK
jgi:hypothetical protein